eukprot:UN23285
MLAPVTPMLIHKLGMTAADFGIVVAAFGFTKLIGNIPFGVASDTWGRKPLLVYGTALMALGTAGTSMATGLYSLTAMRACIGFGVSSLVTGVMMYSADISTPMNRSRTFAPTMAGFSAGTALGPAIGGIMAAQVGLENMFLAVGAGMGCGALLNQFILTETLNPVDKKKISDLALVLQDAKQQWAEITKSAKVNQVLVLSFGQWCAIAGSQMTLLPLLLTDLPFNFDTVHLGYCFAGMSLINVLAAQPFATLADKYGRREACIIGCLLLSGGIISTAMVDTTMALTGTLGAWACGNTLLASAPTAYIQDIVKPSHKAQALSLLRTNR